MKGVLWLIGVCAVLTACDALPPTPDTVAQAPALTIASPLPDARYQAGVEVPIQASARGIDVTRVEVRLDEAMLTTADDSLASMVFNLSTWWTADGDGASAITARTITVTVYAADGASLSESVTFSVIGTLATRTPTPTATIPPTVTPAPILPTDAVPLPTLSDTTDSPTDAAPILATQGREVGAPPSTDGAPLPTMDASAPTVTVSADNLLTLPIPTVGDAPSATPIPPTESRPATATPRATGVIATFTQNVNLRRGASRAFEVVGVGESGLRADVLAISPARDWFYVRTAGVYGWVFRDFVTIDGEVSILPMDAGPATPTLTPTLAPTVPTIQPSINWRAGAIVLDPLPARCLEPLLIRFDVTNTGTQSTPADAIRVQDARVADDSIHTDVFVQLPALAPGQSIRVEITLVISTWYDESHRLTLTLDPGGRVSESDETDNRAEIVYRLDRAACP